jgi:hypothetical protein
MKKSNQALWVIVIIAVIGCLLSCSSSKGHCDAYGNKSGQNINEDVQQNS